MILIVLLFLLMFAAILAYFSIYCSIFINKYKIVKKLKTEGCIELSKNLELCFLKYYFFPSKGTSKEGIQFWNETWNNFKIANFEDKALRHVQFLLKISIFCKWFFIFIFSALFIGGLITLRLVLK